MKCELVLFDGAAMLIKIRKGNARRGGRVYLNTKSHIYSAWKRWMLSGDGMKFSEAIKGIGGHSGAPDAYFMLLNGWRVQPADDCERIELSHLLLPSDGRAVLAPRPDGKVIPPPAVIPPVALRHKIELGWSSLTGLGAAALCYFWWAREDQGAEPRIAAVVALTAALPLLLHLIGSLRSGR